MGPVLSISHGMGTPSLGILLHEIIKLMYHAKCKDPVFIRIGTCGGIGVDGGTVIISDDAVDGLLRSVYEVVSIISFGFLKIKFLKMKHSSLSLERIHNVQRS